MKTRFANGAWILGISGLLWMATAGRAYAAPVPELDPGSAASGIALAVGAAALLAERYRRRALGIVRSVHQTLLGSDDQEPKEPRS